MGGRKSGTTAVTEWGNDHHEGIPEPWDVTISSPPGSSVVRADERTANGRASIALATVCRGHSPAMRLGWYRPGCRWATASKRNHELCGVVRRLADLWQAGIAFGRTVASDRVVDLVQVRHHRREELPQLVPASLRPV